MNFKKNIKTAFSAVIGFFKKENKATKTAFRKLDCAEMTLALMPATVFGCLIFGMSAVVNLALSVAISVGLEFLFNLLFKKSKEFNYMAVFAGLLAGITLNSRINLLITVFVNVAAFLLRKTLFKNNPMQVVAPWLLARALFWALFFKNFTAFAFPFMGSVGTSPIDSMLDTVGFAYPAKYLFFGVHCGNIGETSVLLLTLGGIYLILRKIVNPVIPVSFILSSAVLSLIFGESVSLSLMGGAIFVAAFFLTLDYNFVSAPFYKKLLFGIACAVVTSLIRLIFKSEGAHFAVIIVECAFLCVNRRNIKRFIKFVKKPDFAKLFAIVKKAFSV